MTVPTSTSASAGLSPLPSDVVPRPEPTPPSRAVDNLRLALVFAVSLLLALVVASGVVALAGKSPSDVFRAMLEGSFGSLVAIAASVNHAAILLLVAVGALVSFRAGLVNIGLEGQLTMGAMAGVTVGLATPAPGSLRIIVILAAAATAGGAWAGIASVLRYRFGVHEVISTLLLNFVAFQAVSYAVNTDFLLREDPAPGATYTSPQSNPLPPGARLPALVEGSGYRIHLGSALAVIGALMVALLLARSRWGFRLRAFGMNPRAALRAGVDPARMGGSALVLSGAFAGLAGGVLLTATTFRLTFGISNNYGWEGLLVALVANLVAVVAIPIAVVFGGLRAGGGTLAATGLSSSLVRVVQALVVLAVILPLLYRGYQKRRREQAAVPVQRT